MLSRAQASVGRRWRMLWSWFDARLVRAVIGIWLLAFALAIVFGFALTWIILRIPPWGSPPPHGAVTLLDVVKLALLVVAGLGGGVGLVVAYRRQRHLELDVAGMQARYVAAAQQLGDPQAAVRLAGVYSMSSLADEWPQRRQQCVDVLCAYLRLPWAGDFVGVEPSATRVQMSWPRESGTHTVTREYLARPGEGEVRRTLNSVIREHLLAESQPSWSSLNLNFHSAHLPDADFNDAVFSGRTSFNGATFSGPETSFARAIFQGGWTDFRNAQFASDMTFFSKASFLSQGTSFEATQFASRWVNFTDAWFTGRTTFFQGATFTGDDVSFDGVRFQGAWTSFDRVAFAGVSFRKAQFDGNSVYFDRTTFGRDPWFDDVRFANGIPDGVARFVRAL